MKHFSLLLFSLEYLMNIEFPVKYLNEYYFTVKIVKYLFKLEI